MNAAETAVKLSDIRRMFEGVVPAALCTICEDGAPHICFVSQVEYLDDQHVALSYQFLNRSRRNVLATRRAALSVCDPYTAASITLQLEYRRTLKPAVPCSNACAPSWQASRRIRAWRRCSGCRVRMCTA